MVCDCTWTTTLVVGAIGYFIYKKILPSTPKITPKPEALKKDYKKDVVYLYQFPRIPSCPNMSPFCIKIEILCRANNIPYEKVESFHQRSRNGTLPFIELNGEHIADSDMIEIRLRKHFKIQSLPAEQEAQSVALSRMADNHLFYLLIHYKTSVDAFYNTIVSLAPVPGFLKPLLLPVVKAQFGKKIHTRTKSAIGDFEPKEFDELLHRDLQAVQDSIKGKFLFGDKITPADATVFGQLASVYYVVNCHLSDVLKNDFPAILEYMERVKEEIYPNDFTK